MVALIVAKASNGVIGSSHDVPWYLPADLRYFKEMTTGHTVIMGRRTFEPVYNRLHGPLPNRRNIVISRSLATVPDGFELARSPEEALKLAGTQGTVFVIGGAEIYQAYLSNHAIDTAYITEVCADIPGDVYFPQLVEGEWREISRENHTRDEKNPYDYSFVTLRRSSPGSKADGQ